MYKYILTLLSIFFISFSYGNDVLTINNNSGKIFPAYANFQAQWYPVFCFSMPDGYTDFELKASITNFKAPNDTDIEDESTDHLGNEVVFYFYSAYPYIGTDSTKAAPYQKFNKDNTKVYFQVSTASKYTKQNGTTASFSGNWDGRRYIKQIFSNSELPATTITFSLGSYLASNAKVGGVMMIAVADSTNISQITPTNINLMWTIRFANQTQLETANGKPLYHPIFPIYWISNYNERITLPQN